MARIYAGLVIVSRYHVLKVRSLARHVSRMHRALSDKPARELRGNISEYRRI